MGQKALFTFLSFLSVLCPDVTAKGRDTEEVEASPR